MKHSGIELNSVADGDGVRSAVFISGCTHFCPGCHNPDTHSFKNGEDFDVDTQNKVIEYCKQKYISGLTLTGGDPMYSASQLLFFVKKFKAECPDKTIWIYSGFTYEEILADKHMKRLLNECDVLVDGLYDQDQPDKTLSYKGSYNQRIIDLKATKVEKSIVIWGNTYL